MKLKILIYLFFSLFIYSKETEIQKIKDTIISMITVNSNDTIPSFYLKYKKNLLNITNFSYFGINQKKMNLIINDSNNKPEYILKNLIIVFKFTIGLSNFTNSRTDYLIEVEFDQIIFIENDYFLNITEVIPSSLYISNTSQINHLSYFSEFNNLDNMTYIDEYGNRTENVSIISIFLKKSKECIFNKLLNVQNSFNLLTNDLDKILNIVMNESIRCKISIYNVFRIYSIVIKNIEIPLNYLYFVREEEDKYLLIKKMKFSGDMFYYDSMTYNKIINFNFFNDENNVAYFDEYQFYLDLNKNNIYYDNAYTAKIDDIYDTLEECLQDPINDEVEKYFNK